MTPETLNRELTELVTRTRAFLERVERDLVPWFEYRLTDPIGSCPESTSRSGTSVRVDQVRDA